MTSTPYASDANDRENDIAWLEYDNLEPAEQLEFRETLNSFRDWIREKLRDTSDVRKERKDKKKNWENDEKEIQWREGIKPGDIIDAQNFEGEWNVGKVGAIGNDPTIIVVFFHGKSNWEAENVNRYSERIAKFGTHTNIDIDEISPVKIISLPKPPKVDSKEAQEKYIVQRFAAFGVLKEKKDCKKLEILSGIDREKIWEIYQTLIS